MLWLGEMYHLHVLQAFRQTLSLKKINFRLNIKAAGVSFSYNSPLCAFW